MCLLHVLYGVMQTDSTKKKKRKRKSYIYFFANSAASFHTSVNQQRGDDETSDEVHVLIEA